MTAAAPVSFSFRQVRICTPQPADMPRQSGDVPRLSDDDSFDFVRVAKWNGRVVGGYRLTRLEPLRYRVAALVVCAGLRHCGVGRWLLGHAIGIAESKGARIIDAPLSNTGLFRAFGFTAQDSAMRLRLAPE